MYQGDWLARAGYPQPQAVGSVDVLNAVVMLQVGGLSAVAVQITDTWAGVITFEGSIDGQNYVSVPLTQITSGVSGATATANGIYIGSVAGFANVRARFSTATSGLAVITITSTLVAAGGGSSGGGGGGGAVTIADGADIAEGATADAAVTGDNTGTVSAKLRGINKILADVWDAANHWFKVSIQNATLAVTQSGTWTIATAPTTAGTSTNTNVAASASTGQLLAASAGRLGATLYNDADKSVYVKLGTTASATSFTVRLLPDGFFQVPFGYTGRIDAIWDTGPTGSMRISELSA